MTIFKKGEEIKTVFKKGEQINAAYKAGYLVLSKGGRFELRGDINDNVTGGTPSPTSYSIEGEKGDTGTFIVTVSPNTNYTLDPDSITGVSGIRSNNDITAPTTWVQDGDNVRGTFSYEFPQSGYGLNRRRTDNFTIDGSGTFVPPTYTYTINFVDNTSNNMEFSTTAITITGEEGDELDGSRNITLDDGYKTKTLTAFDNTTVLSTSDDNSLTVSWTGDMPEGGGSAIITVGGTAELIAKTISGTITNSVVGAVITPSTYTLTGSPGTEQTVDVVIDANSGKKLLSDIKIREFSGYLSASTPVATKEVLNETAITQYTTTLTGTIQTGDRTANISVVGNTSDLINVAWSGSNQTVTSAESTFTLTFYSTDPDSEVPIITRTESASYITIGTISYANGVGTVSITVNENAGGIRSATITVTSDLTGDSAGLIVTQSAAPEPDTATTGYFDGFEFDDKPTDDITLNPMVTTHDYDVVTNGSWQVTIFFATPSLEVPGITVEGYGTGTANGRVRIKRASNAPTTGTVNVRLSPDNDSSVILQQLAVTYTPEQ